MRGSVATLAVAVAVLLAGSVDRAQARPSIVSGVGSLSSVAVGAAGTVQDPPVGERRGGARLAGVRAPEARMTSLVGDVLDVGGKIACGVVCIGVDLTRRVGGKAADIAGDLAASALDSLAQGVAAGGAWMMRRTARLIERTTTPVLTDRWFRERYDEMRQVAVLFAVLAFLAGVIGALVARDGSAMLRTVGIRLPIAFGLTAALGVVTQMSVEIADNLTSVLAADVIADVTAVMRSGAKGMVVMSGAGGAVPAIITLVVALAAIATAFVLWLELLLRDAGIYVVVFLAPIVAAAMIWERCVPLLTRTLWTLFALILSKPLIVALMSLASSGLADGITESGLAVVLPVLVLMLLACLAPWALLALVPLLEGAATHQSRRALTGMGMTAATVAAAGAGGQQGMQALMGEHFAGGGADDRFGATPTTASGFSPDESAFDGASANDSGDQLAASPGGGGHATGYANRDSDPGDPAVTSHGALRTVAGRANAGTSVSASTAPEVLDAGPSGPSSGAGAAAGIQVEPSHGAQAPAVSASGQTQHAASHTASQADAVMGSATAQESNVGASSPAPPPPSDPGRLGDASAFGGTDPHLDRSQPSELGSAADQP